MGRRWDPRASALLSFAFVLAAAAAAEAQSITLSSGASYHQGQTGAGADSPTITISCVGGVWNTTNGVNLVLPSTINVWWDPTVNNPTLTITQGPGAVSNPVTFPDDPTFPKVCHITITSNFGLGPSPTFPPTHLQISGLRFKVGAPGAPNSAPMGANNAGGTTQLITDGAHPLVIYNNPTIASFGGSYSVQPTGPVNASRIDVTEAGSFPGILSTSEIRVTIPNALNMEWNTAITNPAFGGTASGKVLNPVVYENVRTARINVTGNFAPGDTLQINGLQFTNIGADSSGRLFITTNTNSSVSPFPPGLDNGANPSNVNAQDSAIITITGLPKISSALNQNFTKGDPVTNAALITITESGGTPKITALNDIRIMIPNTFNMDWDTSRVNAGSGLVFGGTGVGHIAGTISYPTSKIALIAVNTNFLSNETLTINGMRFLNFSNASAADNLELDTTNDGVPENLDTATIAIGAPTITSGQNQVFDKNQIPTAAKLITITDGTPARITAANDIKIKIPVGFNMEFDTTKINVGSGLVFGGTGVAHAAQTISYPDTHTALVAITSDFGPGQTLTINGLFFQNFLNPSTPDNLQLEVNNLGTNCNIDNFFIAVGGAPTISSLVNQAFTVNDTSTTAAQITITEANGFPSMTAANGIDIRIPLGYPMEWDTTITAPAFTGTGAGHVTAGSPKVTYPTVRTAHIVLGTDFVINQTLIINGLKFQNFAAPAAPTNLGLFVAPGPGGGVSDDKTIAVGRPTIALSGNQTFGTGDPSTVLNTVTITEDTTVPRLLAAKGIRIVLPPSGAGGLNCSWDTTITVPIFTGTGAGHAAGSASYPDSKTALIALSSDFNAGEVLNIAGLKVMSFGAPSGPLGIRLDVSNLGTICSTSIQTLAIGARPQLLSVLTQDTNGNGSIDHLVLTFNKPINAATTSVTTGLGFTIGTPSYIIGAGSCSGAVVTFTLVETGLPDTGVRPFVSYDPMVGNLQDTGGLTTNFTGPMQADDGAPPVVVGITKVDLDGDGHLDKIIITFSEPLALGKEDIADWKIIDADGTTDLLQGVTTANILIANSGSAGTVTFTLPNILGTTGTPRFLYLPNLNGQDIKDLATPTPNVTIKQTNCILPVIDVGQSFAVGPSKVTLDASRSSDPNGQPLSFSWANGSPFILNNPNTATPFFLGTTAGTYSFTVTVSNLLVSDVKSLLVTIINVPPGADAGSDQTCNPGASIYLVALASSDANGESLFANTLTATWAQIPPGGVVLNPVINGVVFFTAPSPAVPNILTFEVTVSDGVNSSKARCQVRVNGVGPKPAPTADAGPDQVAFTNTDVQLDGSRSVDPSNQPPLTYLWTSTFPLTGATTVNPTFHPTLPGLYTFALTVTNAQGTQSFPSTVRILVQSPSNQAPVAEAHRLQPTGEIVIGDLVVLDGTGSRDPEGKPLGYAWLQTAGPPVILDNPSTLRPSFTPVLDATYAFQLIVSDGVNQSLPSSVSLTAKATAADVTFTTSIAYGAGINAAGHAVMSASPLHLDPSTSDLPNTWFWYLSQTGGPAAPINSLSGNAQLLFPGGSNSYFFTPPSAGTYKFRLAATTFNAIRAYADVTVVVDDDIAPTDAVPSANAGSPQTVAAGTVVTLDASGSQNLPAPTYAGLKPYWKQVEGPPVALSDPYATNPTFTPIAAGQYTFELSVSDATSSSAPSFVVVTVTGSSSGSPATGGGNGGCGILGTEWMLLLPLLWLASWVHSRIRPGRQNS